MRSRTPRVWRMQTLRRRHFHDHSDPEKASTRGSPSYEEDHELKRPKLHKHNPTYIIDIDDTITYLPKFFKEMLDHKMDVDALQVIIITFRDTDNGETVEELSKLIGPGSWHWLVFSDDPDFGRKDEESLHIWKSRLIEQIDQMENVDLQLVFEDMPEVISLIPDHIPVMMPTDGVIRGWMRSLLYPDLLDSEERSV